MQPSSLGTSRVTSRQASSPPSESTPHKASVHQAVSDGVITAGVKAVLHADVHTQAYDIHVETFHGVVQLSGFVETTEVRSEALALARIVEGVQEIDDLLDIRLISLQRSR